MFGEASFFDSLVAHADFDLFDPTSYNEQPRNSAFTSSASESSVCIPELQPNPSLQGCSRFTAPRSDEEVTAALAGAVPKNTQRTTNWALNIWKQWTYRRQVCHPHDCPHLYLCTNSEYDQWLSKFVLEIRRADGMPYPPSTLYSICCGLQRYIRDVKPDLNLLKDPQFSRFQRTLDAKLKRLHSTGLGVKKRKAEPISISDENLLWEKKLLGDHLARVLLDTTVGCTLHCAVDWNTEICFSHKWSFSNHQELLHTWCTQRTSPKTTLVDLLRERWKQSLWLIMQMSKILSAVL